MTGVPNTPTLGTMTAAASQPIETSVQVALRIRPLATDGKGSDGKGSVRGRHRPDTEVITILDNYDRSQSPQYFHHPHGQQQQQQQTQQHQPQRILVVPLQRQFTFDHVFGPTSTQEEVYRGSAHRLVEKFLEGFNVTIMAYGQTSSGKTYTMGTAAGSASISDERAQSTLGIIPRAISELFQLAKAQPQQKHPGYKIPPPKTSFRVSFVELYNEDLIDLLVKGDHFRPPITIREDVKGNIFWTGVQEVEVTSAEEVMHLLWFGSQNRQTHSTEMNEKSSRSHAIFSISLRQERFVPTIPLPTSAPPTPQPPPSTSPSPTGERSESPSSNPSSRIPHSKNGKDASNASHIPSPFTSGIVPPSSKSRRQSAAVDPTLPPPPPASGNAASGAVAGAAEEIEPEGSWIVLKSKFHFVDLAGSERLKRTSAIGDRAKEGISINAGLHALGNVISALGDPSKKASHVPYRDSKLTRLLQDSLGGNALSLMIACVSPSELNLGETVNTLKYANRARNIKNASSQNQEVNLDSPEYLRSVIQKLKAEIRLLKEAHARNAPSSTMLGLESLAPKTPASSVTGSNRHSIATTTSSVTTAVAGDGGVAHDEDDQGPRMGYHLSQDSTSTDLGNGYLGSVREEEEDDEEGQFASRAGGRRGRIPSLMLSSLDSSGNNNKSFQDFVEPVIEEYEKVIMGLESHLALTQAALNHSELMLEEQQARMENLEDENRTLTQHQAQRLRETQSTPTTRIPVYRPQSSAGFDSSMDRSSSRASLRHYSAASENGFGGLPTPSSPGFATAEYKKLEQTLQRVQKELAEAESRKAESDRYIAELEQELDRERRAVITPASTASPKSTATNNTAKVAAATKRISRDILPEELDQVLRKIARLEQRVQEQQEEAQEVMALSQMDKAAVVDRANMDKEEFERLHMEREAERQRREEELIVKLQSKAELEHELATEKAKYDELISELQSVRARQQQEQDELHQEREEVTKAATQQLEERDRRITGLEEELKRAKEQEATLREELSSLKEQLTKLQADYKQAAEMEEMLHVAVADLEQRLKTTLDAETKQKVELEENLARIHELEQRSLKAEQDAIHMVETMKSQVQQEKATAETRLADELLELLEKMDAERHKVEVLQAQVEQQLTELEQERAKSAEQEAKLADLLDQSEEDSAMIVALETAIARHKAMLEQKEEALAKAEARAAEFEGTLASKVELLESMERQSAEHTTLLAAKIELIQQLEQRLQQIDTNTVDASEHAESVAKVQADLEETIRMLKASEAKAQEQEQELESLRKQLAEAEEVAKQAEEMAKLADELAKQAEEDKAKHQSETEQSIQELRQQLTRAQADLDDAETRVEEAQRRHESIDLELQALKTNEAEQQAKIQDLEVRLSEATAVSPANSRPASVSAPAASAAAIAAAANGLDAPLQPDHGTDAGASLEASQHTIQRLEKEKARYRALVRENEKEIQRLTVELELIADEFSTAASAFEEAEDEMKARIEELEKTIGAKGLMIPANNVSSTSLLLNGVRKEYTVPSPIKAQIAALKEERDQAAKSMEELSTIVADLNEKNHSLQEKLLLAQREQESMKVQHVLEMQALRDRLERAEHAAGHNSSTRGSPVPGSSGGEDDRVGVFERILRHRASQSSTHGEDTLATPRQSWSTNASIPQSAGSTVRAGRHESTLIQQAKHIKQLEERLSELQNAHAAGATKDGPQPGQNGGIRVVTTDIGTPAMGGPTSRRPSQSGIMVTSPTSPFGLGISRAASDPDLAKTPLPTRHSMEKMASPPMRAMVNFPGPNAMVPPTPPPTIPLPSPPVNAAPATSKTALSLAHLQQGSAPPSPRHNAVLTAAEPMSPTGSPHIRPHRSASQKSLQRHSRERTSTSSDGSLVNGSNGSSHNANAINSNSVSSATPAALPISSTAASALEGIELNELKSVVDTLAHQVQALKLEQATAQTKIHGLERSLQEAEAKLRLSEKGQEQLQHEREQLKRELEAARKELEELRQRSEREKAGLEEILEKEKRERARAAETRAAMEARVEEILSKRSKFACF